MIEHTVTFRLQYAAGSPADTAFLAAARELATMPGVRDFAIRRQVSPRCDHTLGIAMRFTDQDAYDHSNAHLRHVAFVRDRWTPDVASLQEANVVPSPDCPTPRSRVMRRPAIAFLLAAFVLSSSVSVDAADDAVAAAAEPARFLAVTVTAGFRHGSIATSEAVIEEIGRTSGLFHVDFLRMPPGKHSQPPRPKRADGTTDDEWNARQRAFQSAQEQFKKDDDAWKQTLKDAFAKAFAAESLASFDGVMFVNTTGKLPVPDLDGLLDWVGSGKAFVGIHAATDTFNASDAYGDFIGGIFAGHPWRASGTHAFVVHEPTHPVAAMYEPRFRWKDEIYQYDRRYKPENVRVLVSLDMTASTPKEPWHVPVSWVRDYGKGRVFYTNFGHNDATWKDSTFQKHLLEGTAWSLGRLDAPATPNPEVQAAEYVRSAIAAACEAAGVKPDDLLAKADESIARNPRWAIELRPQLLEIRALAPTDRTAAYDKLITEIGK